MNIAIGAGSCPVPAHHWTLAASPLERERLATRGNIHWRYTCNLTEFRALFQYKDGIILSFQFLGNHHVKGKTTGRMSFLNMGLSIPVRRRLYIETGPWALPVGYRLTSKGMPVSEKLSTGRLSFNMELSMPERWIRRNLYIEKGPNQRFIHAKLHLV